MNPRKRKQDCRLCENYRTLFCPLREWDPEAMDNCPDFKIPPDDIDTAVAPLELGTPTETLLQLGDRVIGQNHGIRGLAKNIIVTIVHVTPQRAYAGSKALGVYQFMFERAVGVDGRVFSLCKVGATTPIWHQATPEMVREFYLSKYSSECLALMRQVDLGLLTREDMAAVWEVLGHYVPKGKHPNLAVLNEFEESLRP